MPTRTFTNLPKEKKIRILKAAKKEFSRVPLEKAVIANIVKDAKIPRGSFYQYFDSIEDLFTYLINYMYGIDCRKFLKLLEENNNDFYEALKISFANKIDRLSIEENRQFRINTITTLFNCQKESRSDVFDAIEKSDISIDLDMYPCEVKNSVSTKVLDIIKMIGKSCIEKFLSKRENADETKKEYNKYIDLVKSNFTNTL